MDYKEAIDVLQSVKRRELKYNDDINKLSTNPSESIGARAIDVAISALKQLVELEKAEAGGMLVRLPCAPDKHCYAVVPLNCEFMNCPKQDENGGCDNNCPDVIVDIIPEMIPFGDLVGVRLFATHEEASAAPRGYTLESGGTA